MLFNISVVVLSILAIAFIGLYSMQHRMIYFPDPTRVSPTAMGLDRISERILDRPDGTQVIAWYGKAKSSQPTLLYFHGNGGNLAGRAERIATYHQLGYGIYMMSYRGYSGSTGAPSETANVADAVAAYDDLKTLGIAPGHIILYGESLGSGVAVQVATQRPVGGVILDAPFTSLADAGAVHYPYLPVRLAIRDRYNSAARISEINAPLLILHGEQDQVVPFEMGRRLFTAALEPKTFAAFPEAGHSDHGLFGSFQTVQDWLKRRRGTSQ